MNFDSIKLQYEIPANNFTAAGEIVSSMKKVLSHLVINPAVIKRVAIAAYEGEMNAVIHAGGGSVEVTIDPDKITVKIADQGAGIPDLELAMQEGYSTAPEDIKQLGFGAGMGLPNMKENADVLDIDTRVGQGTTVVITVYIR